MAERRTFIRAIVKCRSALRTAIDAAELPLFNSRRISDWTHREHVLVLGDSHIGVFRHLERDRLLRHVWIRTYPVMGATAQGLVNPNSKTDALKLFRQRLEQAEHWQTLVFQIGEVDCGFLIWYRALKYELAIESQLAFSLDNYRTFLRAVRSMGFNRIIVLSAPAPTIDDNQQWGPVANARREVTATLRERTDLTTRYNELLRQSCQQDGYAFVDLSSAEIDPDTGVVRPHLLNPNPLDHHLAPGPYSRLVAERLAPHLLPG